MIKEFKVYYGNVPASQEQLNAIEEIVVEQEIADLGGLHDRPLDGRMAVILQVLRDVGAHQAGAVLSQ